MPTMTRGERIVRSVLFTSVALVSVMAIGIGYQQQTMGGIRAMSAQDKAPAEEMPVDVGNSYQPVKEPTLWCCNGEAGLCYEQSVADGCNNNDASYADFNTCAPACAH